MTVQDFITSVRRRLDEESATNSKWTDAQLVAYGQESFHELLNIMYQGGYLDQSFEFTSNISFVKDTWEYSLPSRLFSLSEVQDNTSSDNEEFMDQIGFNNRYSDTGYYLRAGKIGFASGGAAPGSAVTDAVTLYYLGYPPEVHYGTAQAGAATTITLATTATQGTVYAINDYYNGATIEIVSGTGVAGETRTISDYVGSTKVATIDSAWTTGSEPSTDTVYSINFLGRPEWERFHVMYAVVEALAKDKAPSATARIDFNSAKKRITMSFLKRMWKNQPRHSLGARGWIGYNRSSRQL